MQWNTKNSTRFVGTTANDVAAGVSGAVFPSTGEPSRPDAVMLYDPADWRSGLLATSLLRPLGAILLPAGPGAQQEVARLQPKGSATLGGESVLLMEGAG